MENGAQSEEANTVRKNERKMGNRRLLTFHDTRICYVIDIFAINFLIAPRESQISLYVKY
jgi:hypothetical protein